MKYSEKQTVILCLPEKTFLTAKGGRSMNALFDKCEEVKKQIKSGVTRRTDVKFRVTPVIFERLKLTSRELHVSRNELINVILGKVLI
jgi:hypothetical protein